MRPILPVPDEKNSHQVGDICVPKTILVQAVHRLGHVGVAQHERDVPPRRGLRHEPQRHRRSAVTARPNSVGSDRRFSPTMQTMAMSGSQATSAKCVRFADDVVEAARVVDGHRHAHL